jgi:hypothetical protein
MYARSPLTAAPGVTGWSLKKRIEEIMINRRIHKLGLLRTAGLIAAGVSILCCTRRHRDLSIQPTCRRSRLPRHDFNR